jgi:hypothetical protein
MDDITSDSRVLTRFLVTGGTVAAVPAMEK